MKDRGFSVVVASTIRYGYVDDVMSRVLLFIREAVAAWQEALKELRHGWSCRCGWNQPASALRNASPMNRHPRGFTPAAPPSATHPRRSRGPPAGGSGANPRDWRRAAWGRARADASSRAAPRPAGPRAHGSPR